MVETGDIQDLKQVLQAAKTFFLEVKSPSLIREHILKKLIDDSFSQLEQGVSVSNIQFTYEEIYGNDWPGTAIKDPTTDNIRRSVAKYIKQVNEYLTSDSAFINFLKERCSGSTLVISSDGSLGGNKKHIFLKVNNDERQSFGDQSIPIFYRATAFPKPSRILKPLLRLDMGGDGRKRFLLMLAASFFVLFGAVFGVFYGIVSNAITVMSLLLLSVPCFLFLRAVYEIGEHGLTRVPEFALNLSDQNVLVTTSKNLETGDKVIELLQWEAVCPICDSKVYIEKGSHKGKGRYVGRCSISTQEHVYTFDHATKKGEFLR